MDVSSLAASAIASSAQQTRDGFAVASLKIANEQQQLLVDLVAQSTENIKALTAEGVGQSIDRLA